MLNLLCYPSLLIFSRWWCGVWCVRFLDEVDNLHVERKIFNTREYGTIWMLLHQHYFCNFPFECVHSTCKHFLIHGLHQLKITLATTANFHQIKFPSYVQAHVMHFHMILLFWSGQCMRGTYHTEMLWSKLINWILFLM